MAAEKNIQEYFKYVTHRMKDNDYRLEKKVCNFVSKRLFAGIDTYGLDKIASQRRQEERAGKKTINIYVGRHLSEFDWQEIQRVLAHQNMMTSVQAGDNLFIGPLDPLLRHLGGFKVFREEATIFSENWIADTIYRWIDRLWKSKACGKALSALHFPRRKPVKIDKTLAKDIYLAYMNQLINVEGRDILVFPEYIKNSDKKVKYGRSYSGELLEFTPLLFKLLRDINKNSERQIQLVPVNVSYERVVEDQSFRTLEKMKTKRFRKNLTYVWDYFFNYTHWLVQKKKGRAVIKFGEPVQLRKKFDFKIRLHDDLRKRVGVLQTIFPSQILAYSFHNDTEVAESDLIERVAKTLHELQEANADLRYVEGLPVIEIITTAYEQFNQNRTRRILVKDAKEKVYIIKNQAVLSQYKNHIVHLFQKWYDKEQLIKTIKYLTHKDEKTYY